MRRLYFPFFNSSTRRSAMIGIFTMLFATLSLCSCSDEDDFSFYASVSGTVVDNETGTPLSGTTITITPGNTSIITTSGGTFEFTRLSSGQYTLIFQKSGYQTNRKNISLVAGDEAQIAVTLAKIP